MTSETNLSWSPDGFQNETGLDSVLPVCTGMQGSTHQIEMSPMTILCIAVMTLGSVSSDYYSEDEYYSTYNQIYRRQDDFDTVRVIDEGISNILSALPGQVSCSPRFFSVLCSMLLCAGYIQGAGGQGRCLSGHGPGQQAQRQLRSRGGDRDGPHYPGQLRLTRC